MSSSANSATASVVPTIDFPSLGQSVVVTDEDADGMAAVITQSVEQNVTKQSNSTEGTSVCTSSESLQIKESYVVKTPPFNLVMENVSEYIDLDEAWLSEGFYSHQIGYKICLAVRIESCSEEDDMLNVVLGISSTEGLHRKYLVYPCSGLAKILILNPIEDSGHQVLELMFTLEKPILNSYSEIPGEAVKIPQHFTAHEGCLFFHVETIDIDKTKYSLWLLDTEFVEDQQGSQEDLLFYDMQ